MDTTDGLLDPGSLVSTLLTQKQRYSYMMQCILYKRVSRTALANYVTFISSIITISYNDIRQLAAICFFAVSAVYINSVENIISLHVRHITLTSTPSTTQHVTCHPCAVGLQRAMEYRQVFVQLMLKICI